jgi:hypothetical protein
MTFFLFRSSYFQQARFVVCLYVFTIIALYATALVRPYTHKPACRPTVSPQRTLYTASNTTIKLN